MTGQGADAPGAAMTLYGSTMSPFVRIVRVVARETGAMPGVREIVADPWGDEAFRRVNPLGKIPALVTADGEVLYDSPVICEYLDDLHPGAALFPRAGRHRWRTLTLRACASGLTDAAYLRRNEAIRAATATIGEAFIARQDAAIGAALDALEHDVARFAPSIDIGSLTVGAALGYLDFRFAGCGWRERCPALAGWWAGVRTRPSFSATEHADPPGVTPPPMAIALRLGPEQS